MTEKKIEGLRVFLKDGFQVTSVYGPDALAILTAIGGCRKPTDLVARSLTGQVIDGEYFELTKSLNVDLGSQTKFLHEGQIIVIIYDEGTGGDARPPVLH